MGNKCWLYNVRKNILWQYIHPGVKIIIFISPAEPRPCLSYMIAIFKWLACFLLILLLNPISLNAQMPGMRKYTQLDGFTATTGYTINQDKKGYIWLGTDNGGVFFDGKNFRSVLGEHRIPDTDIINCYPLGKDRVLLLSLTQPVCYFDNDTLVTFEQNRLLKGMSSAIHNLSTFDQVTGAYWLWTKYTPDTLYRFLGRDIKKYPVTLKNFGLSYVINSLAIGTIEYKPHKYMPCVYDPVKNTVQYLRDREGRKIDWNESFIYGGNTRYLLTQEDRAHEKWVGINEYSIPDMKLLPVRKIKMPVNSVPRLYIDRFNNLWLFFIGEEGFYYYGDVRKNGKAYYFREPATINSLLVDRNGNLWLSSPKNTLYFISKNHIGNLLLTDRFPFKNEIPKSIAGDRQGSMCISYVNSNEPAYIKDDRYKVIKLDKLFVEGSRKILAAKNSYIFFDRHIALYDISRNVVRYISDSNRSNTHYKDLCFFGEDGLLAASNLGVTCINSYSGENRAYKMIFDKRATAVEALTNGSVLIGTPKGLYVKKGLEYDAQLTGHHLLDESNITDIQQLPGNRALIGTNAYGLFFYSAGGPVKNIGPRTLSSVRSIYRQNDSTCWVATNAGAITISFDNNWNIGSFKTYTFYDGLPSNSINDIYVYKDTAYIATSEGLGIIPLKDKTLSAMSPPEIYLNVLQAGKQKFHSSDTSVSVLPGQNDIYLSLSAISYESLGNVQYYYRLYPLQDQWIATPGPDIRFAGLPPGHYEFQAFARNAKGYKSRETIRVNILIRPAFWQTVYFKLALTLIAIAGLFLLSRWFILERHKKKIEKIQQKKRLAELELEAIKAQINPHFIYNCLNSIQYLNYQSRHELAQEYLGLFARMIRMTMKYSRQAFITLNEEVDYLSNYLQLEKLRFKEKLQYRFDVEKLSGKGLLLPAMLVQPYVENALKHGTPPKGTAREITIEFDEEGAYLTITISDNGPGFTAGRKAGTLGLRLSASRASSYNELFGLDIKIDRYNKQDLNPNEQGAVVNIKIPKLKNGNII